MEIITNRLRSTLCTETMGPRNRKRTPMAASINGKTTAPRTEPQNVGRRHRQHSQRSPITSPRGLLEPPCISAHYDPLWGASPGITIFRHGNKRCGTVSYERRKEGSTTSMLAGLRTNGYPISTKALANELAQLSAPWWAWHRFQSYTTKQDVGGRVQNYFKKSLM